jgi:hypothetical protein
MASGRRPSMLMIRTRLTLGRGIRVGGAGVGGALEAVGADVAVGGSEGVAVNGRKTVGETETVSAWGVAVAMGAGVALQAVSMIPASPI